MTYGLRRLRRKGLIRRVPPRYVLTGDGRRLAVCFTKTYTRIVCPTLAAAELDPALPQTIARRTPLGRPWRDFDTPSTSAWPRPPVLSLVVADNPAASSRSAELADSLVRVRSQRR